jgi:cytochrome c-type biogenesis protein CcmE
MTPRRQRLLAVTVVVAGAALALTFGLRAFRSNIMMFYVPSQVASGEAPVGRAFRLGGMVTVGSVHRESGKLDVSFTLTDLKKDITVAYAGILPDLFREGQGIIAHGTLGADGVFHADEVLAKHDESYTPPPVAEALKSAREETGAQGAPQ